MGATFQDVLAKYSKEELAEMLANLTDGVAGHDLHAATGLPTDQCERIAKVGHEIGTAIWR